MVQTPVTESAVPAAAKASRAGRDVPVAIGVGVAMAVGFSVPLFVFRPIVVVIISAAAAYGLLELVRALRVGGLRPPLVPLVVGGALTVAVGYPAGTEAVVAALLATVLVAVAVRVAPDLGSRAGYDGQLLPDVAATVFAAVYVPFLAAFAVLLAAPADGPRRVFAFICTTVFSDIGGFAVGVLTGGRHKLAPAISPGKSVEGFVGSLATCAVVGTLLLHFTLHVAVWQGVVFGLAMAVGATLGDLGESALKRDLGIKDMGALLPGHGGLLDRLDSLLVCAPVAWLLLAAFAPVGH